MSVWITSRLIAVGLILGMIGVVIIFFWGPPQPVFSKGIPSALELSTPLSDGRTVAEHLLEAADKKCLHKLMSSLGLFLIFIGFSFQLIDAWI